MNMHGDIQYTIRSHPPFRLDLTVWTLRRGGANRIDCWDGLTYRRAMVLEGKTVLASVRQQGAPEQPELLVTLSGKELCSEMQEASRKALLRLLGLEIDLSGFYAMAADDPFLRPLVERFKGVKPPRFPTLFESLANGIVFQQLSLAAAVNILNRLAERYGAPFHDPDGSWIAFPEPRSLAAQDPDEVRRAGLTVNKARALVEAARTIQEGALSLESIEELDNEPALAKLMMLRGVGVWTADYVLLRGAGRLGVFPRKDAGARGGLNRWLSPDVKLTDDGFDDLLSRWRNFAGMVYFHLLLRGLAEKGTIQ